MADRDLHPERLLRALRTRLRDHGVPAALRPRILRRAGVVLRVDHAVVEAVLDEPPLSLPPGDDEPYLYEALLEAAVLSDTLDELDLLLRLGGELAVGVSPAAHGAHVAAMLQVPRVPPATQRGGEGFGVLQDLFAGPEVPRLGTDHGPSSSCPACCGAVRLTATHWRRETSRGVLSEHDFRCRRCFAEGTLERFYSHRLRGNQDTASLRFPGLLGPLANRRWCGRGARALAVAGGMVGVAGGPWGPLALGASALAVRARASRELGAVAAFVAGAGATIWWWRGEGTAWAVAAWMAAALFAHALWCFADPPVGWREPVAPGAD